MSKALKDLTKEIDAFCEKRNWGNDDPNQLISSILIELGELAEHYQWSSRFQNFNDEKKTEVGYEFVDVLFYLLRLASKSGIDIEKSFNEKLPKLAKKFKPGEDWNEAHDGYRKSGKSLRY